MASREQAEMRMVQKLRLRRRRAWLASVLVLVRPDDEEIRLSIVFVCRSARQHGRARGAADMEARGREERARWGGEISGAGRRGGRTVYSECSDESRRHE